MKHLKLLLKVSLFVAMSILFFTGCKSEKDEPVLSEKSGLTSVSYDEELISLDDPFFSKYYAYNDSVKKAWGLDTISNDLTRGNFWNKVKIVVKADAASAAKECLTTLKNQTNKIFFKNYLI